MLTHAARSLTTEPPETGRRPKLARADPLARLHAAVGNRAVARTLQRCGCGGGGDASCQCDKKELQRRATSAAGPSVAPDVVHHVLAASGRPLEAGTRKRMESSFGFDFGGVRIHDGARAAESARAVSAVAYTVGNDIVFDAGRYSPGTSAGDHLLVHELTHVVQQNGAPSVQRSALEVGASGTAEEREADAVAHAVANGGHAQDIALATSAVARLQRTENPMPKSRELLRIEDLLSYGIFDWKIFDSEAIEALTLLEHLSKFEQGVFFSEQKYVDRLQDNLPDDYQTRFNALWATHGGQPVSPGVVSEINDLLTTHWWRFKFRVSTEDATKAFEKLKTIPETERAVAIESIEIETLIEKLPTQFQPELQQILQKATAQRAAAVPTAMHHVTFTSDHHVMKQNDADWTAEGPRVRKPEWSLLGGVTPDSLPISQTMGTPLRVKAGFTALPIKPAAAPFTLKGDGGTSWSKFSTDGSTRGGEGVESSETTSTGSLPSTIGEIKDHPIDWSLHWGDADIPLGTTKHTIFTTFSKPADPGEVTTNRMRLSVQLAAGDPSKAHDIVKQVSYHWDHYDVNGIYPNPWEIGANLDAGAQCIDLVRFVKGVIDMIGLPGKAEPKLIWAHPTDKPEKGRESDPYGTSDADFPGVALFDDGYVPNNFEAALRFEINKEVHYYPGGVATTFDSPQEVINVFRCLARFTPVAGHTINLTKILADYGAGPCTLGEHSW